MKLSTFKLSISFLFLFTTTLFSQSLKISGTIVNEKNEKIASASVMLFSEKVLVKAMITNSEGTFVFQNLKSGNYSLKSTNIGYTDYVQENIKLESQSIDLGTITLKENAVQLNEVVVKKEKPLVQVMADKTVFNVENTINATGNTGFELLRKAPGVVVDNNDNIIVEGKNGVLIYIDGKQTFLSGPDLANYLRTIQSNDIESIEIITQPSSKYDAAGNAGIINIKFKKNKSFGTNGTVSTGLNVGRYATSISSVSFNNRDKKWNTYGNYSNRFGRNYNFMNFYRQQSGKVFESETQSTYTANANNIKLGADYYKNSRNTFGIALTGNFNNAFGESTSRTPIRQFNSASIDSVLSARNKAQNKTYNLYANLNYKFQDTTGVSFNLDLDLGKFNSDRDTYLPNYYLNADETSILSEIINGQYTPITINISSIKGDYEQRFWKGKLGLGFKNSLVTTKNTFDVFNYVSGNPVLNTARSNNFNFDENINALYFNFNRLYKKVNYQIGLRMENTISDGQLISLQQNNNQRVKRNYTDFFPSAGLTYNPNEKNSWALTYSKRIERPSYQSLNPFENQIDELSFSRGNPFLQPQYIDNIKVSHTYKYKINTSLSYSFIRDFFAQVSEAVDQNRNSLTARNVANQQIINLGFSYPFKVNNWWNVYTSINAFQSKYIPTNPLFVGLTQETLNFFGQNTFKLPKDYTMEVSGWYNSPSVWGGTYRTKSLGSLDVAFQKKFIKGKLNTRLAFSDILFTSPWQGDTEFGGVVINGNGGSDSRQVRFNVSYNFGSDEVKKARTRNSGLEDEKNRIGS